MHYSVTSGCPTKPKAHELRYTIHGTKRASVGQWYIQRVHDRYVRGWLDEEDETEEEGNGNENGDLETVTANAPVNDSITIHVHVPPPLKRRHLEIPARTMRKNAQ